MFKPTLGQKYFDIQRGGDMEIEKKAPGIFMIEISDHDLGVINNCINDAIELMVEGEFHARVGVSRQEAMDLLKKINIALATSK